MPYLQHRTHDILKGFFLLLFYFSRRDVFVRSVQSALRSKDYFDPDRMRTKKSKHSNTFPSEHICFQIRAILQAQLKNFVLIEKARDNILFKCESDVLLY